MKSVIRSRPRHARLLLPLADALRLGSVPGVLRPGSGRRVPSRLLRPVMAAMARWDAATAGRVDRFLANSQYVAGRIRRYYNRGSTVVYPPVDTVFYRRSPSRSGSPPATSDSSSCRRWCRTSGSRRAIEACRLAGVRLTIVGRGPEEARLRAACRSRCRVPGVARATRRFGSCTGGLPRSSCPGARISAWSR